jgi:hypothetical protein
MPSQPPEKFIENIRRKLHASIPHYAALLPEMRHADVERELVDLAATLGNNWPGDWSPPAYQTERRRLCALLDGLMAAAREDQQANYQQRIKKMMASHPDVDPVATVTAAVDRWLERWLSGKEAGRLP